ncbi:IclR family transcriptional regulator [Pseudorhodoplanes sp.]|uniref:IclR family transcriptional regulator n=1 Tax=Pseudorhodoplanes sp. TaxID=1934341 RepID=UPI002B745C6D|nr:IclR family transcriptional regulator [Pseudorhodoplanes sp.]HWV53670.1 IclR family transcriptional regulator [Pseudorhodoplanes sp.]
MSKIVERTLDFIELFAAERRPLSLSDISRLLGIPASSCHDVLRALVARGYLYEMGPRAGFYPTVRLLNLAKIISEHDPILVRAELLMRKIRDTIDESVSLAKGSKNSATYLLVLEPSHPLRFIVNAGSQVRSLHATSAGKAYLGSLPSDQFEGWLKAAKLTPMTANTIRSKEALRSDIETSKRRGYFLNRAESVEDATTVSSLFRWHGADYIVTIAGPTSRMGAKLDQAIKLVTDACKTLGEGGAR